MVRSDSTGQARLVDFMLNEQPDNLQLAIMGCNVRCAFADPEKIEGDNGGVNQADSADQQTDRKKEARVSEPPELTPSHRDASPGLLD